jgi:signal transduction histidine kinase
MARPKPRRRRAKAPKTNGPFAKGLAESRKRETVAREQQAALAIENVRLRKALETRNAELTEALDQQAATSDVLRVISSSPTAVQPVFGAIAASTTRLCQGLYGLVFRYDGQEITLVAEYGFSPDRLPVIRSVYPRPPDRGSVAAQAILERRVIAIADAQSGTEFPHVAERARAIGYRSILSVPMLIRGDAIGAINVVRVEAIPFTDTQIALLQTFADQAVIAIENVRLFTELQERNREVEHKSQELAAASQHKSEFLANMSHELRTPLNAIIGFSEVLVDRMFGDLSGKQDEYLRDIHASGQHLLSLINDILDLSKIEAGRMELEPADFDLPTVIDNALILVRERAQGETGPPEPALQRHQVHARGRTGRRSRHRQGRAGRGVRHRHRHRYRSRGSGGRVRGVPAGGECGEEGRGHRARARAFTEVRRAARWPALGQESGRRRIDLHVHAADRARSRLARADEDERRPVERVRRHLRSQDRQLRLLQRRRAPGRRQRPVKRDHEVPGGLVVDLPE